MLNINEGKNRQLMESCRTLSDYARYTQRVRGYARVMEISAAVERAVTECIAEGILSEFLSKNRAEASKVSIYEYDEEKHMRQVREEGQMDGRNEGRSEGEALALITQIQKKCQKGKSLEEIAEDLEKEIREIEAVYDIVRENPSRDREELLRMVLETDAALKKEAGRSSLYEYDEEKHMRQVREEGQMDGRNEGRSEGE
ncbi:MAG: hypothetical protein ACLSEP_00365, partial [Mediterraneibacter gnavus]